MDSSRAGKSLRVGRWSVEPAIDRLVSEDGEVRLAARPMALLRYLAERPGELASKEAIHRDVWHGKAVTDDALTVAVYELRKALGDRARDPSFIETVPGKGYRLVAPVVWQRATAPSADVPEMPAPVPAGDARWHRLRLAFLVAVLLLAVGAHGVIPRQHRRPVEPVPGALGASVPRAVDAYLEGRQQLFRATNGQGSAPELGRARQAFERAIALDPGYAEAHIGLADTLLARVWYHLGERAATLRDAADAIRRGLMLDADLAKAQRAMGELVLLRDHDLRRAEARFQHALRLDPGDAQTYVTYGWLLRMERRHDEAERMARWALELDPLAPGPLHLLAEVLADRGEGEAALAVLDRLTALAPGAGTSLRARVLYELGRFDEAYAAARAFETLIGRSHRSLAVLDEAFAARGWPGVWSELLRDAPVASLTRARLLVRLGRPEQALESLERAAAGHHPDIAFIAAEPVFDPLGSRRRFQSILRAYGLPSAPRTVEARSAP